MRRSQLGGTLEKRVTTRSPPLSCNRPPPHTLQPCLAAPIAACFLHSRALIPRSASQEHPASLIPVRILLLTSRGRACSSGGSCGIWAGTTPTSPRSLTRTKKVRQPLPQPATPHIPRGISSAILRWAPAKCNTRMDTWISAQPCHPALALHRPRARHGAPTWSPLRLLYPLETQIMLSPELGQ